MTEPYLQVHVEMTCYPRPRPAELNAVPLLYVDPEADPDAVAEENLDNGYGCCDEGLVICAWDPIPAYLVDRLNHTPALDGYCPTEEELEACGIDLDDPSPSDTTLDRLIDTVRENRRPHQGRWCFGKTPMQTFLDAMPMTKEKMIAA
jgi:hypothetical protein